MSVFRTRTCCKPSQEYLWKYCVWGEHIKSWVCKIKSNLSENWETDLSDGSPRGRSAAAVNEHKSQSAGVLITHARRIVIGKLSKHSGNTGKGILKGIYKIGYENPD